MVRWTLIFAVWAGVTLATTIVAVDDGHPLPNGISPTDRGTPEQQIQYGLAMGRAYRCVGLQAQDYMNYGCFCGERNTGIDTEPADVADAACRLHDLNLWAIVQNPAFNTEKGPCNCYTQVLSFDCRNGVIRLAAGMNDCQRACGQDLIDMAYASREARASYRREFAHRWQPFGDGFRLPPYCRKRTSEFPDSPFAPEGRVVLPKSEFWPIGKL